MRNFLLGFLSLDLRIQIAILLGLLFAVVWLAAGRLIVRIASLMPWALRKGFRFFYRLAEAFICLFHKKMGELFYNLDNGMAAVGRKTDAFLQQWIEKWREPEKRYWSVCIVSYTILLCVACSFHRKDGMISQMYLKVTDGLAEQLEMQNDLEEASTEDAVAESNQDIPETEKESRDIVMTVATAKDPLSIRDIPSMSDCEILDWADRGTTVIWAGDLAFGSGESGKIEPWARVVTANGITGWARLKYLCPEDENDLVLTLWIQ